MQKIGITEQGDAGRDHSWCKNLDRTDGKAILITKFFDAAFAQAVVDEMANDADLILHVGVTGLGGTIIEPNVPAYDLTLSSVQAFLQMDFPAERLVLRVDPIIPGYEHYARAVLEKAVELGILPQCRCRISVLDAYKHVKERFKAINTPLPIQGFYASPEQFAVIDAMLKEFKDKYGVEFYSCAEPALSNAIPAGCVGEKDAEILGVDPSDMHNPQNRNGCLCLMGKTELLEWGKRRCPNQCAYCYWKD